MGLFLPIWTVCCRITFGGFRIQLQSRESVGTSSTTDMMLASRSGWLRCFCIFYTLEYFEFHTADLLFKASAHLPDQSLFFIFFCTFLHLPDAFSVHAQVQPVLTIPESRADFGQILVEDCHIPRSIDGFHPPIHCQSLKQERAVC